MVENVFFPIRCPLWDPYKLGTDVSHREQNITAIEFDEKKWINIRPVKRLGFPFEYIHRVEENRKAVNKPSARRSRTWGTNPFLLSTEEIWWESSRRLDSQIPSQFAKRRLRKKRENRMDIWNAAIRSLNSKGFTVDPSAHSYQCWDICLLPLMHSTVRSCQFDLISNQCDIIIRPAIRPERADCVSPISSIMCFDLEYLHMLLFKHLQTSPVFPSKINIDLEFSFRHDTEPLTKSKFSSFCDRLISYDEESSSKPILGSLFTHSSRTVTSAPIFHPLPFVVHLLHPSNSTEPRIRWPLSAQINNGDFFDILQWARKIRQSLSKSVVDASSMVKKRTSDYVLKKKEMDFSHADLLPQFSKEPLFTIPTIFPILHKKGMMFDQSKIIRNAISEKTIEDRNVRDIYCSLERFKATEKIFAINITGIESMDIVRKSDKQLPQILKTSSFDTKIKELALHSIEAKKDVGYEGWQQKHRTACKYLFQCMNLFESKCSCHHSVFKHEGNELKKLDLSVAKLSSLPLHTAIGRKYFFKFDPPERRVDQIIHEVIIPEGYATTFEAAIVENSRRSRHNATLIHNVVNFKEFGTNDDNLIDEIFDPVQNDDEKVKPIGNIGYPHEPLSLDFTSTGVQKSQCGQKSIEVVVPEAMNCSAWSIRIAEHCLRKKRVVLFSPPHLNMLPSLVIMAQSYLARTHCDDRVAVVCDGDAEDVTQVYLFFKSCLENSTSIRVVCSNTSGAAVDEGVNAKDVTSRIVIVDRFTTQLDDGFSLLFIVISIPSLMGPRGTRRPSQPLWIRDASRWQSIPSIIITPANPWTGIGVFMARVSELVQKLKVSLAVHIADLDDITFALEFNRYQAKFIPPTKDAKLLCEVLNEIAQQYLHTYNAVERRERWKSYTYSVKYVAKADSVRDVSSSFLNDYISQLIYWDEECEELARIHDIKQLYTYALHDGVNTAKEFLEERRKSHPSRADIWDRVGDHVAALQSSRSSISARVMLSNQGSPKSTETTRQYFMADVLHKVIREASKQMKTEAPSLRAIHRREQFKALIVTDSSEARDQLRQRGHHLIIPPSSRVKSMCAPMIFKWDELCTQEHLRHTINLEDFSHVFHVTDDRNNAAPTTRLPGLLLQCIFAGRTRLITVCMDMFGELDALQAENETMYKRLEHKLDLANIDSRRSSFISGTNIETVLRELSAHASRIKQ